jgi:hypothetical protein
MQFKDIDAFAIPWPEAGKDDPMARIGLRAEFIFRDGYSKERRRALMNIVEQYVAFAGDRPRLYQIAGQRRPVQASPDKPVDLEPLRLLSQSANQGWSIFVSGEPAIGAASHWSLVSVASDDGCLLLHFPLQAFEQAAHHRFRTLFQKWCNELAVEQAYAGLGLVLPTGGMAMDSAIDRCGPYATRFVGLDVDLPGSTARSCTAGIRCINWLTAINTAWLERAGGAAGVLRVAGSSVTSMPYDGGTIFVAGDAPQVGDKEQGLVPEAYLALGRAVAPIRSEYKERLFMPPEGYRAPPNYTASYVERRVEPEQLPGLHYTREWIRRFDG